MDSSVLDYEEQTEAWGRTDRTREHYLVFNYDCLQDSKPSIHDVYGDMRLLKILDVAHHENHRITVFRLGECLLDWS